MNKMFVMTFIGQKTAKVSVSWSSTLKTKSTQFSRILGDTNRLTKLLRTNACSGISTIVNQRRHLLRYHNYNQMSA